MDDDMIMNATSAHNHTDTGDHDGEADSICLHEMDSYDGEGMRELESAGEVLTRVELELAYSSEKLLNLDILLMHVSARESDFESLRMEIDSISDESVEKGLEFDFLSGILGSEVRELENFMGSLHMEIAGARRRISEHPREASSIIERNLKDSEECLKQSQNQLAEMRMQSAKFQRTLSAFSRQERGDNFRDADVTVDGQFSCSDAKLKMHTVEQQRHILRMLEKSLARELSLERRLTDSSLKLDSAEHDIFSMDEAAEDIVQRLFEAENAAEVLMGISKEMMGHLQIAQFNLSGLVLREGEMKSKLQNLMEPVKTKEIQCLEEAEDKHNLANSEVSTLREKVHSLEGHLKGCKIHLQNTEVSMEESQKQQDILSSELHEMKCIVEDLKENTSKAESRAETAEAECTLLTSANSVLNEELAFLKSSDNNMETVDLLEKQLRESDIQLQQAKAAAEASQEQQNMLYSAIKDMENLINDLKSKVSKAESRAEKAEAKCTFLSETNLEVNEELSFLRSRTEFLETSLHKADATKIATAKEIGTRSKVIADLLLQLAMERERLQKQMSSLTKEKNILAAKLRISDADASVTNGCEDSKKDKKTHEVNSPSGGDSKEPREAFTESTATSFQMNKSAKDVPLSETEVEPPVGEPDLETVRVIRPRRLNSKYLMAVLIVLVSVLAASLLPKVGGTF